MRSEIYLIRHGENLANITKEFSCNMIDYSLTSKGVLQAHQTSEYFKQMNIDRIFTSPLKRAIETANIIAKVCGVEIQVMDDLKEVQVGAIELNPPTAEAWHTYQSIVDSWLAGSRLRSFPKGENYNDLLTRMRRALVHIVKMRFNSRAVVVGHGGLFTFTIKDICSNVNFDAILQTPNNNCSISKIVCTKTPSGIDSQLMEWANCSHLHNEAAVFVPGTPEKLV